MNKEQSFLGSGWSFPPKFNKQNRSVVSTSGEEDIKRSLEILLSTRIGERIMLPDYGCNLEELLFQPLDLSLKTYVKDLIKTALLYYEPRIDVISVDIDTTDELAGELRIIIDFMIRITNSRSNIVYPFYKAEGNEI